MNNQASNPTSVVQLLGLLLAVACVGLAASWSINRLSKQSEEVETLKGVEQKSVPTEEPTNTPSAKPSSNVDSFQPTVVLPRQSFAISGDQLETECELFIERMLKALPEDRVALNLAALYYSRTQRTKQADKLWTNIVATFPTDLVAYFNWSTNAIQQGRSERALEILDQAERNGVRDHQLINQRAIALRNLGKDEDVEALLEPLTNSIEMDGASWLQLGLTRAALGKCESARDSLLKARELGINNKTLLNGLVNCSARLKDRSAAESYRKELLAINENVTEFGQEQYEARSETRIRALTLGILGEGIEVYRLAGRLKDAELAALRVLAIDPNSLDICKLLAEIYADKNEPHNQYAALERLTELQPRFLLNYLLMAKAASLAGNQSRAEGLIKFTIASAPDDATSWIAMAEFLIERNRPTEAIWYVEQAIVRAPSEGAYLLLASALRASGQNEPAVAAEAKARELTKVPIIRAQPLNAKGT